MVVVDYHLEHKHHWFQTVAWKLLSDIHSWKQFKAFIFLLSLQFHIYIFIFCSHIVASHCVFPPTLLSGAFVFSPPQHASRLYRANSSQTTKPLFSLCSSFRLSPSLPPSSPLPSSVWSAAGAYSRTSTWLLSSSPWNSAAVRSRVVASVVTVFYSYLINDLFIFRFSFACSSFSPHFVFSPPSLQWWLCDMWLHYIPLISPLITVCSDTAISPSHICEIPDKGWLHARCRSEVSARRLCLLLFLNYWTLFAKAGSNPNLSSSLFVVFLLL